MTQKVLLLFNPSQDFFFFSYQEATNNLPC